MKLKTIVIATLLAVNAVHAVSEVSRFEPQLSDQALSGRPYSVSYTHLSSWAGAGIVFPLLPWMYRDKVNQLALAGANLYSQVCEQLAHETGIDPELTQSGMLIKPPYDLTLAKDWCEKNQFEFEQIGDDLLLPNVAQVRNPRLLQALKQWLIMRNVTLLERTQLAPIQELSLIHI